jgi:protein-disulfide isomerase
MTGYHHWRSSARLSLAISLVFAACTGDPDRADRIDSADPGRSAADTQARDRAEPAPAAGGERIDLRRIGYAEGEMDAPVMVVEFSDFGCPYCARFAEDTYPQLRREYIDAGRVLWVYVPFVMGVFRNGAEAAKAGECAGEQDRFGEMKMQIYAGQDEWKTIPDATELFAAYARELALDETRFASCYREDRRGDRTVTHNRTAAALGIRATPSFLINGHLVEGSPPVEQFREILDGMSG